MIIQVESTSKIVTVDGIEARVWEGETESGIPVHCYITRIAIARDASPEDVAEFESELLQRRPPSADVAAIHPALVL